MQPIKIEGLWTEGYAVDRHVIKSVHLGYDEFGHDVYETTRSKLGELIYKMKYNGHSDTSGEIVDIITPFLNMWLTDKKINCVIPVPQTKQRINQPVFLIAEKIAAVYEIGYDSTVLEKTSPVASKDMCRDNKSVDGTIKKLKQATARRTILLVDDLYSTGSTANECVRVLKEDELVDDVYFLAITKTR